MVRPLRQPWSSVPPLTQGQNLANICGINDYSNEMLTEPDLYTQPLPRCFPCAQIRLLCIWSQSLRAAGSETSRQLGEALLPAQRGRAHTLHRLVSADHRTPSVIVPQETPLRLAHADLATEVWLTA